jgi:hypothetical protein
MYRLDDSWERSGGGTTAKCWAGLDYLPPDRIVTPYCHRLVDGVIGYRLAPGAP